MAFNPTNFSSGGFFVTGNSADLNKMIWNYSTSDNLGDITTHYFDNAGVLARPGDFIKVSAGDGDGLFYVSSTNPIGINVIIREF